MNLPGQNEICHVCQSPYPLGPRHHSTNEISPPWQPLFGDRDDRLVAMAGGLFFLGPSVQARSFNLPCFYAASCQCHPWRSKFSSKCRVRNKKSACLYSKPASFGLISTSERSDGSVVFRFGDVDEMPQDEPPVEMSIHFESSEEIVGDVDMLNEGAENVVPLEEEADLEGSQVHASTREVGSEDGDVSIGVFPEIMDDQLSISGNSDLQGDSHLAVEATLEGFGSGNGPFEEIQLKSGASDPFASDLSSIEENHKLAQEELIESSPEVSQNKAFLASVVVQVDNSKIVKNELETYLTKGGSDVTLDVDEAGDSSQLEKLDAIVDDAHSASLGLDTEKIADAIEHSEEHAEVNISDLPNEVEEKAELNLANQFLSGNQSEFTQASEVPEVELSPSEEAGYDILIDAPKEDMTITPAALDDAMSIDQEESVESEKASAGFGVAVPVGREETQTEKSDIKRVVIRKDTSEMELYLSSGVASLPHPSKESTEGEDVHFVLGNWLGIADGVGQWSMEGAGASSYAPELLENCQEILANSKSNPVTDPMEVIVRGARETHSSGLSTVMVAYFDGQILQVAGVGNSGYIVIRNGDVLQKSDQMIHEFNLPVQIHNGIDASLLIKQYSVRLDEDDVIVLATNGVFDNLYDQEVTLMASDCLQSGQGPSEIAWLLAKRAREVGTSKSGRSPFADAAHAASYVGYTGGKLDDVTVIVSLVRSNPDSRL